VRLGIADHFGWAVAVTANAEHEVVDRRRIELVEPGVTPAPVHYDSRHLTYEQTEVLVAGVRSSIGRASSLALDRLAGDVVGESESIVSMSLRAWPDDFPDDLATQCRAPYEARADAIMYRRILAELAEARGWEIHVYRAKDVEQQAAAILGDQADELLWGPRQQLGPPWAKDHRVALAATVVAAAIE